MTFNGDAPSPFGAPSIFDDPDYRRSRIFDMLGGLGAGLMRAGQPGMNNDWGSLIAGGLSGAAMAGQGGEDRFLRRQMTNAQVQKQRQEMAADQAWAAMAKGQGGQAGAAPPTGEPAPQPGGDIMQWRGAIKGNESGDRYDAVGPDTGRGKAYGAYQVMDFNIGPWTQEVLGRPYTPQEFLADQKAQDAVFDAKFGGYVKQYGSPQAAARAWFAGPGGMNNAGAKDVLGTSVDEYSRRFNAGMGGPQVAQAGGPPVVPQGGDAQGAGAPAAPQMPRIPQTIPEAFAAMPPGVREFVGSLGRKEGQKFVMDYLNPSMETMFDPRTKQFVNVPKTQVGRIPGLVPKEAAGYEIQQQQLANSQRSTDITERNSKIATDNSGKPVPNPTMLDYEKRQKEMEDQFKQAEEKRKQEAGQSEKTFTQEKQIRNEYESQPAVKSYRVVVPMLESAKDAATRPTRAADLNLIYAFAKLMDPDSVVRESETAGVVATASVAERLQAYIGQLNGQAMLNPEMRRKLLDELDSRFVALKESNDVLASQYTDIAKAYNLDPSRIVIPIRKAGVGRASEGNQPSQEELKGWASGAQTGGVRLQYVPGKGTVPR